MDLIKVTLAACRVNAGLTQQGLAQRLGISTPTVIEWEKGTRMPNMEQLRTISKLSGIPMDNIYLSNNS